MKKTNILFDQNYRCILSPGLIFKVLLETESSKQAPIMVAWGPENLQSPKWQISIAVIMLHLTYNEHWRWSLLSSDRSMENHILSNLHLGVILCIVFLQASSLQNETTTIPEGRNAWPLRPCLKLASNTWRGQTSSHSLPQSSQLGGPLDDP